MCEVERTLEGSAPPPMPLVPLTGACSAQNSSGFMIWVITRSLYSCSSPGFSFSIRFLSSSSLLTFFLNFGSNCCSISLTEFLSLNCRAGPSGWVKWNVVELPSCIDNWNAKDVRERLYLYIAFNVRERIIPMRTRSTDRSGPKNCSVAMVVPVQYLKLNLGLPLRTDLLASDICVLVDDGEGVLLLWLHHPAEPLAHQVQSPVGLLVAHMRHGQQDLLRRAAHRECCCGPQVVKCYTIACFIPGIWTSASNSQGRIPEDMMNDGPFISSSESKSSSEISFSLFCCFPCD